MPEEKQRELLRASLCFLVKPGKVLLALGAETKRIGAGFWNGYGGEIEPGETPRQAAIREVREESDKALRQAGAREAGERSGVIVAPEHMEKVAIIYFHNKKQDGSFFICRVHVYLAWKWQGTPRSSAEMLNPTWFGKNKLPDQMMPADPYWLPLVLAGDKIVGRAKYSPFQKELLGPVAIRKVTNLPDF